MPKGSKDRRASVSAARVAVFVEGTTLLTEALRDDLAELWKFLLERLGTDSTHVSVYGFTKQQLVLMDPASSVIAAGKIPLDVFIALRHDESAFDRLVVAFDALPANQGVLRLPGGSCLASERDFLLRGLAQSQVLPPHLRASANTLLNHYSAQRGRVRVRTRPPLGDVEAIYMDPCFEALVMTDASALRKVFGLTSTPASWPRMPNRSRRPDFEFSEIVEAHRRTGPNYLRQPYKTRKHAWAHEVVRKAANSSPLFAHEIARRLGDLVGC